MHEMSATSNKPTQLNFKRDCQQTNKLLLKCWNMRRLIKEWEQLCGWVADRLSSLRKTPYFVNSTLVCSKRMHLLKNAIVIGTKLTRPLFRFWLKRDFSLL